MLYYNMPYEIGARVQYTIPVQGGGPAQGGVRYGRITARNLDQVPHQYTVRRTVSGALNAANLDVGNLVAYDTIGVNRIIPALEMEGFNIGNNNGSNNGVGNAMNVVNENEVENHGMNTNNNGYSSNSSNSSNGSLRRRRNTRRRRSTRRRRNTRRRA